jgi:hypothetical protein
MKTFVDVRAARRFADRVKVESAQFRFQFVQRFEMRRALTRPFRQTRASRLIDMSDIYERGVQLRLSNEQVIRRYNSSLPLYTMSLSRNLYFSRTSPIFVENSTSLSSSVKGADRGKMNPISIDRWPGEICS